MPRIDTLGCLAWLAMGWIGAIALFCGFPGLDLAISGWFYTPGQGFVRFAFPAWEWLRQRVWDLSILTVLLALGAGALSWKRHGPVLGVAGRVWGFILALYLIGPGLLVNAFLKSHSGRARPANVENFGGPHLFTPAGQFTDQCRSNCSFVSGEVSSGAALSVVIWLLAELACSVGRIGTRGRGVARLIALGLSVFVIVQRITTGRHFASDAVFAVLLTLSVALALHVGLRGRGGRS